MVKPLNEIIFKDNSSNSLKKKHNFYFVTAFMMRNSSTKKKLQYFTSIISYGYNFNYPKQKNK